jgi:hypothetical protein
VMTFDLTSRLTEISKVSRDIRAERVPVRTLDPCLAELISTMAEDPVASDLFGREIRLLQSDFSPGKVNETNLSNVGRFVRSLHAKATKDSVYKAATRLALLEAIKGTKNSDLIRSLVNRFCSILINEGYSRQYIATEIEDKFFQENIVRIESRTLDRFLSKFDGADRKFITVVPANIPTGDYIKSIAFGNIVSGEFNDLPLHIQQAIAPNVEDAANLSYITSFVDAKDTHAALARSVDALSILVSMTYLGRRSINHAPYYVGYASLRRSKAGKFIKLERVALPSPSRHLPGRTLARIRRSTHQILENFDQPSTTRLVSSINVSGLSRSSTNLENQLITIWSAIEVLLSDPPKGISRVSHYVENLAPCVCLGYARRYTLAVYSELRLHYERHIKAFFRNQSAFTDEEKRETSFARLLFEGQCKPLHRAFCAPMVGNPLALYRLWKLEQNFGSSDALLKSMKAHERRVKWQLYRIYRTRNDIVHSGRMPPFLGPLLMNVYEYFRGSIGPIIGRAGMEEGRSSLDQILAEIRFDYQMLKSDLSSIDGGVPFTKDQVTKFF